MTKPKQPRLGIEHLPGCNEDCPTCRLSSTLSPSALEDFIALTAEFYGVSVDEVSSVSSLTKKTPVRNLGSILSSAAVGKLLNSDLFTDVESILQNPVAALSDLPGFREDWIEILLMGLKKRSLYYGPVEIKKGTAERYLPLGQLNEKPPEATS